jgi:hypothetical protein
MTSLATRSKGVLARCKSALKSRLYRSLAAKAEPAPNLGAQPFTEVFTKEIVRENRAAAKRQDVVAAVHQKDFIYWYFIRDWLSKGSPVSGPINYYFDDGGRSAAKLAGIVASLGYDPERKVKLLEFASGYGCVSRHLKKLRQFDLVSCDIHAEAIDFLRNQVGVKAIQSAHVPEQFAPPEKYDVVFALSFFTHMPRITWGRWLRSLYNTLNVGGYLIFTTHGQKIWEGQKKHDDQHGIACALSDDGFWYLSMSEQKDLDTAEYGATITMPEFVYAEMSRHIGARDVTCKQAEWWASQDLWIVKREAEESLNAA